MVMRRNPRTPIFDVDKTRGAFDPGTTPPIPAHPPVACFTWAPGDDPLEIDFDASCSSDADGAIVGWAWDFGDGNGSSSGPTVSHVYASAGDYDVVLVVEDDDGLFSTPFMDEVAVAAPSAIVGTLIDTTNMDEPDAITKTPGQDVIFVTARASNRFVSIDVSDKSNPTILHSRSGSLSLSSGEPSQAIKRGDNVWVGSTLRTTRFNVSDPEAMTLGSTISGMNSVGAGPIGLSSGDTPSFAYAFFGATGGSVIGGASAAMFLQSNVSPAPNPFGRIWSEDGLLYIGSLSQSLSIRNADTTASSVASLNNSALSGPRDIVKVGDVLFITAQNAGNLVSVDVSNPASPSIIQAFSMPNTPHFAAHQDDILYVTSSAADCIWRVDVSDPSDMSVIDAIAEGANHWQIVVDGDYAYTTSPIDDAVYVVDIS